MKLEARIYQMHNSNWTQFPFQIIKQLDNITKPLLLQAILNGVAACPGQVALWQSFQGSMLFGIAWRNRGEENVIGGIWPI